MNFKCPNSYIEEQAFTGIDSNSNAIQKKLLDRAIKLF